MKNSNLKRLLSLLLAVMMVMSIAVATAGCGEEKPAETEAEKPAENTEAAETEAAAPAEKEKVTFWYLWSGDSAANLEKVIADYNAQSDKYFVEGLSVGDSQKIITAMSAGNGPDITDDFMWNLPTYASAGVMEPLDAYVEKTGYDLDDFVPSSINACRMDGTLYAMPLNINFLGFYYNKDLLAEAGYTEPPKTMEEMYEMAVATTKVNEDGTLAVCGFPDFPGGYYLTNASIACGGGWYVDGAEKVTPAAPDNEGNAMALKMMCDYREKFGLDNCLQFSAGGKYLDPTDPFLRGEQTFRCDGPWLGKDIVETFQLPLNYGVTYFPYPEDHPELAGRAKVDSSIFFISSQSKVKDGAWDFMMYLVGTQGMLDFTVANGDFPARMSCMEDPKFLAGQDVEFYKELAQSPNLISLPNHPRNGEYNTVVGEQTELCINLKQDIETTLKNIYDQGVNILD